MSIPKASEALDATGGEQVLPIRSNEDVVRVRQVCRAAAVAAGLSLVDQTKVVTAASELARNALSYGGGGEVSLHRVEKAGRPGIRLEFVDRGPGIPDLDKALTDGYSTGSGLGLGLSGSRRLVDHFEIESESDRGTRVVIVKWRR